MQQERRLLFLHFSSSFIFFTILLLWHLDYCLTFLFQKAFILAFLRALFLHNFITVASSLLLNFSLSKQRSKILLKFMDWCCYRQL